MSNSEIAYRSSGGVAFVGPDAVNLFRANVLASSLRLYARSGIIPTRGVTATRMLAHNHPSGSPTPSRADEVLTQTLRASLALVDVRVLDHLIVGGMDVLSFAERGLL